MWRMQRLADTRVGTYVIYPRRCRYASCVRLMWRMQRQADTWVGTYVIYPRSCRYAPCVRLMWRTRPTRVSAPTSYIRVGAATRRVSA